MFGYFTINSSCTDCIEVNCKACGNVGVVLHNTYPDPLPFEKLLNDVKEHWRVHHAG